MKSTVTESGPSVLESIYSGKTVWLSGHTGFKGSWLAFWLSMLKANVHGFALQPATTPALFDQLGLSQRITHGVGDLCDSDAVKRSLRDTQPDFVFHLGAQAIVRTSFDVPADTFMTNVQGTVNVLEALRSLDNRCAAVLVTTDKCYENREWLHAYREEDPLGGFDPYSSSKACAEIAIASWRRSFFEGHPVRVASARAGNVIGGGDWAKDRIVPDCIRALKQQQPIPVRNKIATRPWQHVLEPLSGYLWLAGVLSDSTQRPYAADLLASPFNFGPNLDSNRSVADLVAEVLKSWPGRWEDQSDPNAVHEAKLLNLATDKAFHLLGWKPVWSFCDAVAAAVSWYCDSDSDEDKESSGPGILDITRRQIQQYQDDAASAGAPWALRQPRLDK